MHPKSYVPTGFLQQPSGMTNRYQVRGKTTVILIERRNGDVHQMLIDTADLPRVLALPAAIAVKTSTAHPDLIYATFSQNGQQVNFHRWLMNPPDDLEIDHFDHQTLNNRRSNLRIVDRSEQMRNRRMGSWKIRKGVWKSRSRERWGAFVWLGEFESEREAEQVYDGALAALKREGIIDGELAPPGLSEPEAYPQAS